MQQSGQINHHFSCIVVDDDEIDRLTALAFLSEYSHIEKEVFDFIVKPVAAVRFSKAIQRLEEYLLLRKKADLLHHTLGADNIFIREGHAVPKHFIRRVGSDRLELENAIRLPVGRTYKEVLTGLKT